VKHAAAHGAAANHAKVDLSHRNHKFAVNWGRGQFNFEPGVWALASSVWESSSSSFSSSGSINREKYEAHEIFAAKRRKKNPS
jgi:hypothetical protein